MYSESYELLDKKIQKWIYSKGWKDLKDFQKKAIPVILEHEKDVIVSATTASGKTESVFLPILTYMLNKGTSNTFVLYISPLKALINDQWDRLTQLCKDLGIPVNPWHGDISSYKKIALSKYNGLNGILIITPESLEALLMKRGLELSNIFRNISYIVIDELHSYFNTARGKQIQSLINRVELLINKKSPIIALSATLGDENLAKKFLRPNLKSEEDIEIITDKHKQPVEIQIKNYYKDNLCKNILNDLYGNKNLIFIDNKKGIEIFLADIKKKFIANNFKGDFLFLPHYSNLSNEIKKYTENILKNLDKPINVVCSSTLELGIDIGSVKSVAQIGLSSSVSSLRQRIGRSGRKEGEHPILRWYLPSKIPFSKIQQLEVICDGGMNLLFIRSIAMAELLKEGWCEPYDDSPIDISTLIQQLLSSIVQYNGLSPLNAYKLLCKKGPFKNITETDFMSLLKELHKKEVIIQNTQGFLLLGKYGEKITSNYHFYATFRTDNELHIFEGEKEIGSVPIDLNYKLFEKDMLFKFQGKVFRVVDVNDKKNKILVEHMKKYYKDAENINYKSRNLINNHERIAKKMLEILSSDYKIPYLGEIESSILAKSRESFQELNNKSDKVFENIQYLEFENNFICLYLWKGYKIINTLAILLEKEDLDVYSDMFSIEIKKKYNKNYDINIVFIKNLIKKIANDPKLSIDELINSFSKDSYFGIGKYEKLLPFNLSCKSYISYYFDIDATYAFIESIV